MNSVFWYDIIRKISRVYAGMIFIGIWNIMGGCFYWASDHIPGFSILLFLDHLVDIFLLPSQFLTGDGGIGWAQGAYIRAGFSLIFWAIVVRIISYGICASLYKSFTEDQLKIFNARYKKMKFLW